MGSYEQAKQDAIVRAVKPGMILLRHWGPRGLLYTHVLETRRTDRTRFRVRAGPLTNCRSIERNIKLNRVTNVSLLECALADTDGIQYFDRSPSTSMGHLNAKGSVRFTPYKAGASGSRNHQAGRDAELAALRGGYSVLDSANPVIFLATHGPAVHDQSLAWLRANNYQVLALNGESVNSSDELHAFRMIPTDSGLRR